MRKLISAIIMLIVSLSLIATSTYAWFSMNKTVTATGMQVQAVADEGILISNAVDGNYSVSTDAVNTSAKVKPVTTADFSVWCTASSKKATDGMDISDDGYLEIDGVNRLPINYYLANSFWIKTSVEGSELPVCIKNITVADVNTSAKIDASLRIAFIIGDDIFVYAPVPVSTAEDSDHAVGYDYTTQQKATWSVITDAATISNITEKVTSTPTELRVYCYFEGEDSACKSANITTTLDTLSISFDVEVVE